MGYNMKKMSTDTWEEFMKLIREHKRKVLFNPFYNKRKLVEDMYKLHMGKEVDLDNPKTFNEKLNAMKLDKKLMSSYGDYIDKHKVREYVKEKIGDKYLIPEYLYRKKLKKQDLENLPDSFVLKTTAGSGTNYIVSNKNEEDLEKVCDYLNFLLKIQYSYIWGEFCYDSVTPGILAEKLMLDKNGNIPDDLKCFCLKDKNGKRRKIFYQTRVVEDKRERIMFDENWKAVDYNLGTDNYDIPLEKPKNYKEIINVIDKLSEDFNVVRVDLYILDDKIYFGELTFIPSAGYMKFTKEGIDEKWGEWVDYPEK